jgi:hypothetical protein
MPDHKVPGDRLRPGFVYLVDHHEGGGYLRDSSIHEGGAWRPDCQVMVRDPSHPIGSTGMRNLSITGFRGEYGCALDTEGEDGNPKGFPYRNWRLLREATAEEIESANETYGFRGRPIDWGLIPGEG